MPRNAKALKNNIVASEGIIEQGGVAKIAFNTINRTIGNMTTTIVFSLL
jgi:hypothetical protein